MNHAPRWVVLMKKTEVVNLTLLSLYFHLKYTEFRIHEPTRNSAELNSKKFRGITRNKTNSVFRGIPKWHFRKHPTSHFSTVHP
jgi:hypothetical protein